MRGSILNLILFLILVSTISVAQTNFEPYFIYKENSKVKIGHYNIRAVPQGYTIYTVTDYIDTDTVDYFTLKVETLDRYQRLQKTENFNARFFEGEVVIEKLFLVNLEFLTSIDDEDYIIEGRDYVIPAFLGNGIAISPSWVEMIKNDTSEYKVSEFSRVVDSFDKIKTVAGEFDACIISSKLETRYGETEFLSVYSYFSRGLGPVRTNYYNAKRKLVRYSEIVEYSVPDKS